jgi:hypothetical protein
MHGCAAAVSITTRAAVDVPVAADEETKAAFRLVIVFQFDWILTTDKATRSSITEVLLRVHNANALRLPAVSSGRAATGGSPVT